MPELIGNFNNVQFVNGFFFVIKFVYCVCYRLERSLTQSLRQQQDEAYELSLRADQEKERIKQLEQQEIQRQQQLVQDEINAEQQKKEVKRLELLSIN